MKLIACIFCAAMALALQGCATIQKSELFDNEVSCTVDGSKGLVNSMWGWLGITAIIKQSQADVICERLKPAKPAPAARPAASAKPAPAPTPPPVAATPPASLPAPVPSPLPTPLPATVLTPLPALWPLPVVPGEPVVPLVKP